MATTLQKSQDPRQGYIIDHIGSLNIRFPVAELSEKMKFSRGNVSEILKGTRSVSDAFFTKFCEVYGLDGVIKPSSPGDDLNRERALIKMLYHRVAKLEADRLGLSLKEVMDEMDRDTMIAWNDLEKQKQG